MTHHHAKIARSRGNAELNCSPALNFSSSCATAAGAGPPLNAYHRRKSSPRSNVILSKSLPEPSDDLWGSIHEASHAVVAMHFGLEVELLTMNFCRITHAPYTAPDDRDSIERLIVSAAGVAATGCFLNYSEGDSGDIALSVGRLMHLGATPPMIHRLMQAAHREAYKLVPTFRAEIFRLARALREYRTLAQYEIDSAM
jgi:hypothetical protein